METLEQLTDEFAAVVMFGLAGDHLKHKPGSRGYKWCKMLIYEALAIYTYHKNQEGIKSVRRMIDTLYGQLEDKYLNKRLRKIEIKKNDKSKKSINF